eukprot:scaffold244516_cov27-Prasinocladus_malaysianus.AAC.1
MVHYEDIRADYLMPGYFTTGTNGCVRQWDDVTSKQGAETSIQWRGFIKIRTTAPRLSATRAELQQLMYSRVLAGKCCNHLPVSEWHCLSRTMAI